MTKWDCAIGLTIVVREDAINQRSVRRRYKRAAESKVGCCRFPVFIIFHDASAILHFKKCKIGTNFSQLQ